MAVPTYDELLAECKVTSLSMGQAFADDHLQKFSLQLDKWEKLARFMGIPTPDIENIKSQGDMEEQKSKMLVCWKQRLGSKATYEAMAKALLQIGRTDLAEWVIALRCQDIEGTPVDPPSSLDIKGTPVDKTEPSHDQVMPSSPDSEGTPVDNQMEPSQVTPSSSGSSSGIGEMSPRTPASLSPITVLSNPIVHTAQQEVVISHLRELQEEFHELVTYTESTLKKNKVCLETILRRFRSLPDALRRQHQTDENYLKIRKDILDSKSVKELFDNLTALKHWSYMIPDTLAHIVQDIRIDDNNIIQEKIDKYRKKLTDFKTKTELKDIIGLCFPVPDYCIELKMEVDGWEGKTIFEAEKATLNILRKATYCGGIGWKAVNPGSTRMVFVFLEPTADISIDGFIESCKDSGVISIQIDEKEVYKNNLPMEIYDSVRSKLKFDNNNHIHDVTHLSLLSLSDNR